MAARKLVFHFPPEASPDNVIQLLDAMDQHKPSLGSAAALAAFSTANGLSNRTEVQSLATSCGLLTTDGAGMITLTPEGDAVARAKPDLRPDLVHFLLYTGWNSESPESNTVLWTYRAVSNADWLRASIDLASTTNVLAEEIRNEIHETFGRDPSFGPKSIRGVRKWLDALTPPVVENGSFRRRHFCAPELALMGMGWVARTTGAQTGTDFLLTPERRAEVCRLCLLDLAAVDRVIDWVLPLYPEIIRPGTGAGVYGRFLRFGRWPKLDDL